MLKVHNISDAKRIKKHEKALMKRETPDFTYDSDKRF